MKFDSCVNAVLSWSSHALTNLVEVEKFGYATSRYYDLMLHPNGIADRQLCSQRLTLYLFCLLKLHRSDFRVAIALLLEIVTGRYMVESIPQHLNA